MGLQAIFKQITWVWFTLGQDDCAPSFLTPYLVASFANLNLVMVSVFKESSKRYKWGVSTLPFRKLVVQHLYPCWAIVCLAKLWLFLGMKLSLFLGTRKGCIWLHTTETPTEQCSVNRLSYSRYSLGEGGGYPGCTAVAWLCHEEPCLSSCSVPAFLSMLAWWFFLSMQVLYPQTIHLHVAGNNCQMSW
jgi:hypothetical protein